MKAKLYIGHGVVALHFESQADRDQFLENLKSSPESFGFHPMQGVARLPRDNKTICFNPASFKEGYTWQIEL